MEDNIISMFMDVKLDIRERKLEFSHMKSWSRYFVRVEAVKCFPCYMRISFFASPTDTATDLIVRINIPGLTVQMATSRTKQHSYGLFWKNNRKRCCAYFALETQLLCERHLRWMKKSIRNLELYRQEMMQLRRASRTPVYEIQQEMQPLDPLAPAGAATHEGCCDELGIYQNLDNTQNIMGLQDMLGPLPTVPTGATSSHHERGDTHPTHWSRRVSGVSGIYEEIRDDGHSRLSRASIASGIYEEMKLVVVTEEDGERPGEQYADTPPPPLPPRTRSNTNEDFDLQRSFTAPEVELIKKKRHHWLRLDSMFGRRRTTSTDSHGSVAGKKTPTGGKESKAERKTREGCNADPDKDGAVIHRQKDRCGRLRLVENKRNSFSSPDLSRLKVCETPERADLSSDNLSDGIGSCTSEFYPQPDYIDYIEEDCCFASSEFVNVSAASLASGRLDEECARDVTADLKRLNISERIFDGFNRSANSSTVNLVGGSVAALGGKECETDCPAPLRDADLEGYLEMGPIGTGFNRKKLMEEEVIYRNNTVGRTALRVQESEESIYMSMGGTGKILPEPIRSSSTSSSSSSSSGVSSASEQSCTTTAHDTAGRNRCSVDDKIPSYYPNGESLRTPPSSGAKIGKSGTLTPPAATLPRTIRSAQRATSEATTEAQDRVQASFRTPKATCRRLRTSCKDTSPPSGHQKYATLARISSSTSRGSGKTNGPCEDDRARGGETVTPVTTPISKRFGSLPRFGKIDLSPLRMKINSVLQRHNSGNL
uniref:Uncharacterized protein n=1 Tax=Anopheles dirus TaxID=7168 RepID=A0A182N561_9DIPT